MLLLAMLFLPNRGRVHCWLGVSFLGAGTGFRHHLMARDTTFSVVVLHVCDVGEGVVIGDGDVVAAVVDCAELL